MSSRSQSRFTLRGTMFSLAMAGVLPLLVACPKKVEVVADAAPEPTPVVLDAEVAVLEPIVDDAGLDADADADAKPIAKGPAVNQNVARLKQCCAALNAQVAMVKNAPEFAWLTGPAAMCNQYAAQVGPSGNAPELGALRNILKAGKGIPAVCANL